MNKWNYLLPASMLSCGLGVLALINIHVPSNEPVPHTHTKTIQGPLAPDKAITFNEHIAPIIYQNCASCHRAGQVGPFPLTNYKEVRNKARQIAHVTKNKFMPPWMPDTKLNSFVGERGLTDAEIEIIQNWLEQGAKEGTLPITAKMPVWPDGWQQGKPDAVLKMPKPYTVPAEGRDDYRFLVIPTNFKEDRYVKMVDFHPGNHRVVHHLTIFVDDRGIARRADQRSAGVGYPADMLGGWRNWNAIAGWTPGYVAKEVPENISLKVPAGSDLVLDMHFQPTGKPEKVQSEVALYFADGPGKFDYSVIHMGTTAVHLPANQTRTYTDKYELPVAVKLHTIYPHAHFLAKKISAKATLPDGSEKWLIKIDDWDFNWQDEYKYQKPIVLPAKTVITASWSFDNTTNNVRNPNPKPARVLYGPHANDEMAEIWINAIPLNPEDIKLLDNSLIVKKRIMNEDGLKRNKRRSYLLKVFDKNRNGTIDENEEPLMREEIVKLLSNYQHLTQLFDENKNQVFDPEEEKDALEFFVEWLEPQNKTAK